MKVLIAGTSFAPSYGGPAVSVARLATALSDSGAEIGLWAPDGSAVTDAGVGNGVRRLGGTAGEAIRQFGTADVIHDNGIWLRHNHDIARIAHRHGIARIVSPRGMLEPWALAHKRSKKRVAWILYQRRDLRLASRLHAATDVEARRVERLDLGVPVMIIPNGVDLPSDGRRTEVRTGANVALFLGRLYPIKGLPILLQAWSTIRPAGWKLRIAGPDEAGHEAELKSMVESLGLGDVVDFEGHVSGEAKERLFSSATFLVAPSHSESFGMSIAEALARGLPVLTTTSTPWRALVEHGCGWQVEASVRGISAGLRDAMSIDTESLRQMGARGRAYVTNNLQWDHIAGRYIELYRAAAQAVRS